MDRWEELRAEEALIVKRMASYAGKSVHPKTADKTISADIENDTASKRVPEVIAQSAAISRKRSRVAEIAAEEGETIGLDPEGEGSFRDDGDQVFFQKRLLDWTRSVKDGSAYDLGVFDAPLTEQTDALRVPDLVETGAPPLQIPRCVWSRLIDYQKVGVNWMLDLYLQQVGGILGDEMGLGKTIQVIAFIAALQASRRLDKPVLIVCPATVMKQWVTELHAWWPYARVILLHSSGALGEHLSRALKLGVQKGHVLVTSYGHLQHQVIGRRILAESYASVVLDEGHKIRNPVAEIVILCKQLKTSHRIILSGTPIQNNLMELWSLVDFVHPGRLGDLSVFKNEFCLPINAGGYVNASSLQVQTSYRCACILKDLIAPYLLRRVKADVAQDLPTKREQVLFCQLTSYQRSLYERYIESEDARAILSGQKNVLAGIDLLRKICNHPSLLKIGGGEDDFGFSSVASPADEGEKSGKLLVLGSILAEWQRGSHRVLLFCQTRQMLNIVEAFAGSKGSAGAVHMYLLVGYSYFRMDGTTPIAARMALVDQFNADGSVFLFLLTTKVGGLGINLTGADRVVIYDPDWNPSTDMQARERAWRIGQTRPVTIYRMLTVGTIEEKIYHRQIFKQYLTNRILADPKQTRFFKSSDLYDLFTLSAPEEGATDTGALLEGLEEQVSRQMRHLAKSDESGAALEVRETEKDEPRTSSILDGLLHITGLHSALEHDKLVEKPKQEVLLVEREAERRASQAVEALRQSRNEIQAPRNSLQSRLKSGAGSAAILASIRRHQAHMADRGASAASATGSEDALQTVVAQLWNLFHSHGNACKSDLIAAQFSDLSGEDAVAFRKVLRAVADMVGNGSWKLRDEFCSPRR